MKFLRILFLSILATAFISCEKPSTDGGFSLKNTVWTYVDRFEEDGATVEYEYTLKFAASTATYRVLLTAEEGNETYTESMKYDYSYTYSDDLVILKPKDANMYHLEGEIISNIKMRVSNSEGELIGIFYKE